MARMLISTALWLTLYLVTIVQLARSDQCPVPSPCTCSDTTIDCDNKNLTSVPILSSNTNTSYRLYLRWNTGLVITDDSFKDISLEYLNLEGVTNITMSRHALAHQRNTLKEFSFINADLEEVPAALADLDAIKNLSLFNNKIQLWDEHLMRRLGWTITKLNIAYTGLTSWPNWISHIWNLVDLNIDGNDIGVIPHDAFHTFASTLTHLNIESTGISFMPTALAVLHNLTHLTIGGTTLTDSSFYETWLPSHNSSLIALRVGNTNITHIPFGLNEHKTIRILIIDKSNIKYVDDDALPKYLERLTIVNSLLIRIDGGICNPKLQVLNLSKNKLTSIEKRDIYDCKQLQYLDVHDNSIDYISPNMFNNLTDFHLLNLKGNRLVKIPTALNSINQMLNLYLNDNPLECSCEDAWFPQWRQQHLRRWYLLNFGHVYGQCMDLGIDLQDFNPHCPGTFIG